MKKITSQDIQDAVALFTVFLTKVAENYKKSGYVIFHPDNSKLAKQFKLVSVGMGVFRIAYKYKNLIIKTHIHYDRKDTVINEYNAWLEHKDTVVGAALVPILLCKTLDFPTCGLSIAFSISPLVHMSHKYYNVPCHSFYRHIKANICDVIGDGHDGNIGILNGLPAFVDYQEGIDSNLFEDTIKKRYLALYKKSHPQVLKMYSELAS